MQKKSYKVLTYLCEARPDFLQPHFQEVRPCGLRSKSPCMGVVAGVPQRSLWGACLAQRTAGGLCLSVALPRIKLRPAHTLHR